MKILIEIHIFSIKTDKNCKSRGSHWKSKSRCLQVGSFFDNKKHKADKVHYFQSPPVLEIDQGEQHAQKTFRRTKKFKSRRSEGDPFQFYLLNKTQRGNNSIIVALLCGWLSDWGSKYKVRTFDVFEHAKICALFGRTKWTQNLRWEDQTWF